MATGIDNLIQNLQMGPDQPTQLIFSHDTGGSPGTVLDGQTAPDTSGDAIKKLADFIKGLAKNQDLINMVKGADAGQASLSDIQKEIAGVKPDYGTAMKGLGIVGLLSLLGGSNGARDAAMNMQDAERGWQAGQAAKQAGLNNLLRFQLEGMKEGNADQNGLLKALVQGGIKAATMNPQMPYAAAKGVGIIDKRTGQVVQSPAGTTPNPLAYHVEKRQLGNNLMQDYRVFTDKQGNVVSQTPIGKPYKSSGGNFLSRMSAYASLYPVNVIDTKNNNQEITMNRAELAQYTKTQPGRFLEVTPGNTAQALTKTATIQDIQDAISNVRQSLGALKTDFTPKQRAQIDLVLKDRNPASAMSNFLGSEWASSLTPDQINYITDLAQLRENALAMRAVLGAGQGSESVRSAILQTIPGMLTPNKNYATTQLDKFGQQLNRLSRGVIKVPLRNDTGKTKNNTPSQRNIMPAVNYLNGAKSQADFNARVKALLQKGWTADEIRRAAQ